MSKPTKLLVSAHIEYARKSEQEVLHHWNASLSYGLSRERYKYLIPHNLPPLSAVVSFAILLPIVDPLLAYSTVLLIPLL